LTSLVDLVGGTDWVECGVAHGCVGSAAAPD